MYNKCIQKKVCQKKSYKNLIQKYNTTIFSNNSSKSNKLDNSLITTISNKKNNNDIILNKIKQNKKRTQLNLQKNQKEIHNKNNVVQNISKNSKTIDNSSSTNISNTLFHSIDNSRNFINIKKFNHINFPLINQNIIEPKNNIKFNNLRNKVNGKREKTPLKKEEKNKENLNNLATNYKKMMHVKTNNKINIKQNKTPRQIKVNKNNNLKRCLNNINNYDNNKVIGSGIRNRNIINNISQRLFSHLTVSSKNKIRKRTLYSPKKKLFNNIKNKSTLKRAKTCPLNPKIKFKRLLTSQYSESRFYSKITNFHQKRFQRKKSVDKTINYALGNLTNYNNSYIFNDSKINKEINNDKEKNNLIQNFNNYFKNNSNSNIINNININIKRYSTIEKVKSKGKLVSK